MSGPTDWILLYIKTYLYLFTMLCVVTDVDLCPCLQVLDKRRLQELVKEIDPLEQLDEDVEEVRGQSNITHSTDDIIHLC